MKKNVLKAERKKKGTIEPALKGYRYEVPRKVGPLQDRIMIGIPMTGTLRAEWVLARYGQVIPCNWSQSESIQWIDQFSPINFLVADARNIIANEMVVRNFEWLLFIDHDVIVPPDLFLKMNDYMVKGDVPVVSGLYFTKSIPSEPLIYRGNGSSYYKDWTMGDKVWVSGIPMGCTLIHGSILKAIYEEIENTTIGGRLLKKIFETPSKVWQDPETFSWYTSTGTEDLAWCQYVRTHKIFEKAGWPEYEKKEFPFLLDTSLFCTHIDESGRKFPMVGEEKMFYLLLKERKKQDKERLKK